ncbi:MAG: hypothetical protein E6H00_12915 [Bacillati bacterium ANGP1]|uniref:Uncharacterized protein n=1 Tax=Candidatus Segetimicrobium genomatis TaxID=2569760 RepID=A0A537JXR0_9BACT|nr:MAG: hypothetical protein E6H00_12915 [Terrabacteria group bacterium ANGP1]
MVEHTKQGNFEGWCIIELFGHAKEVGYVTTEAYGTAVLFRVDTPELPEREYVLESPEYTTATTTDSGSTWTPAGAKVKRQASPARSRLIGPGAIYSILPCTETAARKAIEGLIRRPLILLELPKGAAKELTLPIDDEAGEERCCEECGSTPEDGHLEHCSFSAPDEDEV